jgi:hypothetical protein
MPPVVEFEDRRLRKSHKAIAEFMCEHPLASLGEIAVWAGYSYSYTSIIINSDAFRAYLTSLEDDVRKDVLLPHLRDRLQGAANLAVERLAEKLAVEQSTQVLTDSTEVLLRALGYGAPKTTVTVNTQANTFVTDKETLARGRALLTARLPRPPEDETMRLECQTSDPKSD